MTTMANWTPSDDKVSAITNASWHSYQLGCMAGHFVTKAQKFCLTRFAAQNPDWMPKSIAGRFFLDHLQIGKEASKLKKSPTGQSEDWVQAKKKECPKYVDLTSGYSDNETASQSQAEKVSAKKHTHKIQIVRMAYHKQLGCKKQLLPEAISSQARVLNSGGQTPLENILQRAERERAGPPGETPALASRR